MQDYMPMRVGTNGILNNVPDMDHCFPKCVLVLCLSVCFYGQALPND